MDSVQLKKNYIQTANMEIRFDTEFPDDGVFGLFLSKFTERPQATALPIMNLPDAIRYQDPSLRFSPWYRLDFDGFFSQIGPHVIVFNSQIPYIGWEKWKGQIFSVLEKLDKGFFSVVSRLGIRYVNFFPSIPVIPKLRMKVEFKDQKVETSPLSVRYEKDTKQSDHFVIQVVNNSYVVVDNQEPVKGSILDLDCFMLLSDSKQLNMALEAEHLHSVLETEFFSMLKDDFLKELNNASST